MNEFDMCACYWLVDFIIRIYIYFRCILLSIIYQSSFVLYLHILSNKYKMKLLTFITRLSAKWNNYTFYHKIKLSCKKGLYISRNRGISDWLWLLCVFHENFHCLLFLAESRQWRRSSKQTSYVRFICLKLKLSSIQNNIYQKPSININYNTSCMIMKYK